jgi:hypothetical protein
MEVAKGMAPVRQQIDEEVKAVNAVLACMLDSAAVLLERLEDMSLRNPYPPLSTQDQV